MAKLQQAGSEAFLAAALDEVVECVMLFGQWPQPKKDWKGNAVPCRIQFSLSEFMSEEYGPEQLGRIAILAVINWENDFDWLRSDLEREIEAQVRKHLDGSQIVDEHAQYLEEQAKEDADCDAKYDREVQRQLDGRTA